MSDILTSGFNRFHMGMSHYGKSEYKKLVDYYSKFVKMNEDFNIMLANQSIEVKKLREKLSKHDSESLRDLVKRREADLEKLKEFAKAGRDAYFSEGQTKGEMVNAYMQIA